MFAAAVIGIISLLSLIAWMTGTAEQAFPPSGGRLTAEVGDLIAERARAQALPHERPANRPAAPSGPPMRNDTSEAVLPPAPTGVTGNGSATLEIEEEEHEGQTFGADSNLPADEMQTAENRPAPGLPPPAEQLAALGLTHREQYWVLAEDDDLREVLQKIEGLEEQARQLAAQWNQLREPHHSYQLQHERARETRQIAMANQLQQQLQPGRQLLARAMRTRSELILAALAGQATREKLSAAYGQLGTTAAVQNALAELDPLEHRLGPSTAFAANARRLDQSAAYLLNAPLQSYWSSSERGVFYIDVTIDDRAFWTCAVRPKAEFSLVPAQLLTEAGLDIPAAGGRDLNIGGVRFTASAMTLPALRLGRFVSRDVPVLVLPPHVQRLEGFLCPAAFAGLKLAPQPVDGELVPCPD